mmetsp:Transcript_23048/g.52903  ORF Transcript_23048/g.52903 Transcript_23048/m.52903 type:complete len:242 (+) Transcript_23048:92-817(+)
MTALHQGDPLSSQRYQLPLQRESRHRKQLRLWHHPLLPSHSSPANHHQEQRVVPLLPQVLPLRMLEALLTTVVEEQAQGSEHLPLPHLQVSLLPLLLLSDLSRCARSHLTLPILVVWRGMMMRRTLSQGMSSWSRVALRRQLEAQAFAIDMISNETMCQLSKLSAEAPRQLKLSLYQAALVQHLLANPALYPCGQQDSTKPEHLSARTNQRPAWMNRHLRAQADAMVLVEHRSASRFQAMP